MSLWTKILTVTLTFLLAAGVQSSLAQTQKGTGSCLAALAPLKQKKESVGQFGGIWTLFEQYPILRPESSHGLQLDSKANKLIGTFHYLCETLNGVPLNDLARYLVKNVRLKGKNKFIKELRILGRSEGEIKTWMQFTDDSLKNEARKLDLESVLQSIDNARPLLNRYTALARELGEGARESHIRSAKELTRDIQSYLSSDANLALGLLEMSQVPYWDFDENHGGS